MSPSYTNGAGYTDGAACTDAARLTQSLAELCRLIGEAADRATEALLQAEVTMAEAVIADRSSADARADACTAMAFRMVESADSTIALRRIGLRAVLLTEHLQRMAAITAELSAVAIRNAPEQSVPEEMDGHIAEMGRLAASMADTARSILRGHTASAPGQDSGRVMEQLNRHLLAALLSDEWRHPVTTAVDVALLGRLYDRFAAHAASATDTAAALSAE